MWLDSQTSLKNAKKTRLTQVAEVPRERGPAMAVVSYLSSPGYTRLNSVRAVTLTRSRPVSVLYLPSKGSLPEDIIKSDEGASLTIC